MAKYPDVRGKVEAIYNVYRSEHRYGTQVDCETLAALVPAPALGQQPRAAWCSNLPMFGPVGLLVQDLHFAAAGLGPDPVLHKQGELPIDMLYGPWQTFRPALQGWLRQARVQAAARARTLLQGIEEIDSTVTQRALAAVRLFDTFERNKHSSTRSDIVHPIVIDQHHVSISPSAPLASQNRSRHVDRQPEQEDEDFVYNSVGSPRNRSVRSVDCNPRERQVLISDSEGDVSAEDSDSSIELPPSPGASPKRATSRRSLASHFRDRVNVPVRCVGEPSATPSASDEIAFDPSPLGMLLHGLCLDPCGLSSC